MRLLTAIMFCLMTMTTPAASHAGDSAKNSGIVTGMDHAFGLTAPKGWVLDSEAGKGQDLAVVVYPKGSTWVTAETVMYGAANLKATGKDTLDDMIKMDVEETRRSDPGLKVTDGKPLKTEDGKKAVVKYLEGINHEAVAFIDEEKVVSTLVLSSRTKEGFTKALPAFREFVGSYVFLLGKEEDKGK